MYTRNIIQLTSDSPRIEKYTRVQSRKSSVKCDPESFISESVRQTAVTFVRAERSRVQRERICQFPSYMPERIRNCKLRTFIAALVQIMHIRMVHYMIDHFILYLGHHLLSRSAPDPRTLWATYDV